MLSYLGIFFTIKETALLLGLRFGICQMLCVPPIKVAHFPFEILLKTLIKCPPKPRIRHLHSVDLGKNRPDCVEFRLQKIESRPNQI